MVRVLRRHIGLADIEYRHRDQGIGARRLVLQPGLVLLAFTRLEGAAVELLAGDRIERRGIADVGRKAAVEQIEQARAARRGGILDLGLR
ncbi:hypothetical protein G6F68_021033 [Rhizopus microsporus]|nr:hypothetical protein G6F68_021033 [Rhizopus microsporus]